MRQFTLTNRKLNISIEIECEELFISDEEVYYRNINPSHLTLLKRVFPNASEVISIPTLVPMPMCIETMSGHKFYPILNGNYQITILETGIIIRLLSHDEQLVKFAHHAGLSWKVDYVGDKNPYIYLHWHEAFIRSAFYN